MATFRLTRKFDNHEFYQDIDLAVDLADDATLEEMTQAYISFLKVLTYNTDKLESKLLED